MYYYAEFHYAECHYAECHYAECHYAECHYAECHYAEWHNAECHYAEWHYAECRVSFFIMLNAIMLSVIMLSVMPPYYQPYTNASYLFLVRSNRLSCDVIPGRPRSGRTRPAGLVQPGDDTRRCQHGPHLQRRGGQEGPGLR